MSRLKHIGLGLLSSILRRKIKARQLRLTHPLLLIFAWKSHFLRKKGDKMESLFKTEKLQAVKRLIMQITLLHLTFFC